MYLKDEQTEKKIDIYLVANQRGKVPVWLNTEVFMSVSASFNERKD